MDNTSKNNNSQIWKCALGIGAGLGVAYYAYKNLFSNTSKNIWVDPLTAHEAADRSKFISDIKYNLSFKLLYQENKNLTSINTALVKSSIKGYLELEFNLSEYRDVLLEFSGILLSLKKFNSDEKVPFEYCNKNHRIVISKEGLALGKNKFCFTFTHANCDGGILYNEHVNKNLINFFILNKII